MRFKSLSDWLSWQENLHPSEIELGLSRVSTVFRHLHAEAPAFPVITVAGTNGKGSSVAMLEAIYRAAGFTTATYTSPHLLRYNERIRFNNQEVSDEALCDAFERVDQARGEVSLTYFEFGTLAALDLFYRSPPDVAILEVGMGGRLDAVNILDADVALITAIGIDHVAWLGHSVEEIAREKAGIMRPGKPVVFSGSKLPQAIARVASEQGAILYVLGQDFSFTTGSQEWAWSCSEQRYDSLPLPALQGLQQFDNASGVLQVIQHLQGRLAVAETAIRLGLQAVSLPGRFQVLAGLPRVILDVAHNVDSIHRLAAALAYDQTLGRTLAVVGMLSDKDHAEALAKISAQVDGWYLAGLQGSRGMQAEQLAGVLDRLGVSRPVLCFTRVHDAMQAARDAAMENDRIVVFGSFYTVAEAMPERI